MSKKLEAVARNTLLNDNTHILNVYLYACLTNLRNIYQFQNLIFGPFSTDMNMYISMEKIKDLEKRFVYLRIWSRRGDTESQLFAVVKGDSWTGNNGTQMGQWPIGYQVI